MYGNGNATAEKEGPGRNSVRGSQGVDDARHQAPGMRQEQHVTFSPTG